MWSLHGMGKHKFVQMVRVTWPIWPPCLYMVKKKLKNLLVWNQKANELETWYAARVLENYMYQVCSNEYPGFTLTYFTVRPNVVSYAFVKVCVCVFGFNVAFNNFSVISRRCLVVTGSSMLTFIVLPHWSIMSQTLGMIPHPVTLSWHWVDQS